jgi:putative addiction module component (TIGR02574 family)
MPLTLEEIEKEARDLSLEERGQLALALIRSLQAEEAASDPAAVEKAWQAEVQRRLTEYDRGVVQAIPGSEARARVRRNLR